MYTKKKKIKMTKEQKNEYQKLLLEEKKLEKQLEQELQKQLEIKKEESSKLAAVLTVDTKINDETPIANIEPISKPTPTVEQSTLLLQRIFRGHQGRNIASQTVYEIIRNVASNRIKQFILRRKLFKLIYNSIDGNKKKEEYEAELKKLRAAEKRQKALLKMQGEEYIKDMDIRQNNSQMEEVYKNLSKFKKVQEKKPILIDRGNKELDQLILEEQIKEFSAKRLQARIRSQKHMIPIGIEINRILQIELEQQREIESKTLNSLFSTIWIDPDEVKPVEDNVEKTIENPAENLEEKPIQKPKKKVLAMPKPID